MKNLIVILVVLFGTVAIPGQTSPVEIDTKTFERLLWDSLKTTQLSSRQGLRYTETQGDRVLTLETDQTGATRVSYVNPASGVGNSGCIIIGDKIYERRGMGPWIMRTRADHMAEQNARLHAQRKAREEKDHTTHERIRTEIFENATFYAINSPHVVWSSLGSLNVVSGFLDGDAVTSFGWLILKGRSVRKYKVTGVNNRLEPTVRGAVRKNIHENDYWFDAKTGAIVKAVTKMIEIRGDRRVIRISQYEWDIEPKLVISVPTVDSTAAKPYDTISTINHY